MSPQKLQAELEPYRQAKEAMYLARETVLGMWTTRPATEILNPIDTSKLTLFTTEARKSLQRNPSPKLLSRLTKQLQMYMGLLEKVTQTHTQLLHINDLPEAARTFLFLEALFDATIDLLQLHCELISKLAKKGHR